MDTSNGIYNYMKELIGEVTEFSKLEDTAIGSMYAFIIFTDSNGQKIHLERVLVGSRIAQRIAIGRKAKYYLMKFSKKHGGALLFAYKDESEEIFDSSALQGFYKSIKKIGYFLVFLLPITFIAMIFLVGFLILPFHIYFIVKYIFIKPKIYSPKKNFELVKDKGFTVASYDDRDFFDKG